MGVASHFPLLYDSYKIHVVSIDISSQIALNLEYDFISSRSLFGSESIKKLTILIVGGGFA
jgi:hypothetical protein